MFFLTFNLHAIAFALFLFCPYPPKTGGFTLSYTENKRGFKHEK